MSKIFKQSGILIFSLMFTTLSVNAQTVTKPEVDELKVEKQEVDATKPPLKKPKVNELKEYLTDFGGAISASSIVGSTSAIINIQSSQDLVLAINSLSSSDAKGGFALALTPARTSIMPMSGESYFNDPFMRLLGALTVSYATNNSTVSNVAYKKSALSVDTNYYFSLEDDPVIISYKAFYECKAQDDATKVSNRLAHSAHQETDPPKKEALTKQSNESFDTAIKEGIACQTKAFEKIKWNASRISLSYGEGYIAPEKSGTSLSMGKTLAISALWGVGDNSAINLSLRRSINELDIASLEKTPVFKNSSLAAIRFTTGSQGNTDMRWLIEASNASLTTQTVSNSVFKYAVGLDKKLLDGVWLEFRYGRAKAFDGKEFQNKGLLSVNWSPSSSIFNK